MTTATTAPTNGNTAINKGLHRYADALGSRRAVRKMLGRDVDPDFNLTDFLFAISTKDAGKVRIRRA